MFEYLQLVRQNNILIIFNLLVVGSALAMRFRQLSRTWWLLWAACSIAASCFLIFLHTPPATLSYHPLPVRPSAQEPPLQAVSSTPQTEAQQTATPGDESHATPQNSPWVISGSPNIVAASSLNNNQFVVMIADSFIPETVDQIRDMLRNSDRPTLIEVRADFGMS